MLDWQQLNNEELNTIVRSNGILFNTPSCTGPSEPILPVTAEPLPDGTMDSIIPYWSGIINRLGRHSVVPYKNSRLIIFNINYWDLTNPVYYRFRLIGAQDNHMYRFSISGHKLIIVATDGFFTEPMEVDYIHVHSGERYDFLLRPKTEAETNGISNYHLLAETVQLAESKRIKYRRSSPSLRRGIEQSCINTVRGNC